jgi:hypothetical protein
VQDLWQYNCSQHVICPAEKPLKGTVALGISLLAPEPVLGGSLDLCDEVGVVLVGSGKVTHRRR